MLDKLVKEQTYNHPIDKVWKAITEKEQISKWFIHSDFEAKEGYDYTFTATEEHGSTQIHGTVLKADPYTLVYTWKVGDAPLHTTVTWHLESIGSQTKLTLEHAGISQFDRETAEQMLGHFGKGWDACLSVLPNHLNNETTEPAH